MDQANTGKASYISISYIYHFKSFYYILIRLVENQSNIELGVNFKVLRDSIYFFVVVNYNNHYLRKLINIIK